MDDVRAAAERLRADAYQYSSVRHNRRHDEAILARAWLRDNPPDDAEPATREWVLSASVLTVDDQPCIGPARWYDFRNGGELLIDCGLGEFRLRTRGDVRRMCQSLGLPVPS